MPIVQLTPTILGSLPLSLQGGGLLQAPRLRLHCLVRLPQFMMPRDGVIDTGAPFTCFPRSIWSRFREGTDYEWLPFDTGFQPPLGQLMGWRFSFRMAQFLTPLTIMGYSSEVDRPGVVAQFADGDPPGRSGHMLPWVMIGVWGGILEGSKLAIDRGPNRSLVGTLEFP